MTPDIEARAATPEELCDGALKHYEEISLKTHHWNNQIPQAIRFWYLQKPALERELAAAQPKAAPQDAAPRKDAGVNVDADSSMDSTRVESATSTVSTPAGAAPTQSKPGADMAEGPLRFAWTEGGMAPAHPDQISWVEWTEYRALRSLLEAALQREAEALSAVKNADRNENWAYNIHGESKLHLAWRKKHAAVIARANEIKEKP